MATIEHLQPAGLVNPGSFTQVVTVRGAKTIHVSGQVAWDADNNIVGAGDLRAQTEQVFKNLQTALAAAGATFANVVKWTTYVVNYKPADRAVIAEVRQRFLGSNTPPASTLIGVQSLVQPELLIEVEAIAVVD